MFSALAGLGQLGLGIAGAITGNNAAENAAEAQRQYGEAQARAAVAREDQLMRGIAERRTGTADAINYLKTYLGSFADPTRGEGELNLLRSALGVMGPDAQRKFFEGFQTDPGYAATLKAGTNAIETSQAGGGLLRSGGTLKALQDYGARLMTGQIQDRLSRLQTLGAGERTLAQGAASTLGTGTANLTNNLSSDVANYLRLIGEAQAGGMLGRAGAEIGAVNAENAGTANMLQSLGYGLGGLKSMFGGGVIGDLSSFFGGGNGLTFAAPGASSGSYGGVSFPINR